MQRFSPKLTTDAELVSNDNCKNQELCSFFAPGLQHSTVLAIPSCHSHVTGVGPLAGDRGGKLQLPSAPAESFGVPGATPEPPALGGAERGLLLLGTTWGNFCTPTEGKTGTATGWRRTADGDVELEADLPLVGTY